MTHSRKLLVLKHSTGQARGYQMA